MKKTILLAMLLMSSFAFGFDYESFRAEKLQDILDHSLFHKNMYECEEEEGGDYYYNICLIFLPPFGMMSQETKDRIEEQRKNHDCIKYTDYYFEVCVYLQHENIAEEHKRK